MKNFFFLFLSIILISVSAIAQEEEQKPAEYTILGLYSPFINFSPDRLIGKVEKVIEKSYWAIPDGDKFRKGNPMAIKERNSLYYDWEVILDESGDIRTNTLVDENNKVVRKTELFKENNILTRASFNDSYNDYDKLRFNSEGDIVEILIFRNGVDTFMWRSTFKFNLKRDTLTNQIYDNKGILRAKNIAVVDKDGQYSSRIFYDENGKYQRGQEYKFNEKRDLIEVIFYNKRKKITEDIYFSHFEYDQKGNWIKKIFKNNSNDDIVIQERTYTYFE